MRRYSPIYFIKQSVKGLWRNGVMSLASITVLLSCLIVMGCFTLLVINIDYNLNEIGDLNEIAIFVNSEVTYSEGDTVKLASSLSDASGGLKFLGWSTDPDAESAEFGAGADYTVSEEDVIAGSITMYAIWENKPEATDYKIRYNTSGVTVEVNAAEDTGLYKDGAEVLLAPALQARYSTISFLGWSLEPNSTEASYAPESYYYVQPEAAKGGVITFYAVWSVMPTITTYEILYDSNRVEISGDLPTDRAVILSSIERQINALDSVEKLTFVSKEEALEQERERLADKPHLLAFLYEDENPYRDGYTLTYTDNDAVATLEYRLTHIDGVDKVNCRTDFADSISNLKNGIILVFVWFMVILFVVSIFVIINTVKLAVFARRQEIGIMRFVGATNWFIALPFVIEGAIIGIISGVGAYFLQWYMYNYVQKMMISDYQLIKILDFSTVNVYILIGFLFIGVLTGVIGSSISLRKYMKA